MQIGYTPDFRTPKPEQSAASIIRFKCNANYFTVVGFPPPTHKAKASFRVNLHTQWGYLIGMRTAYGQ